MSPFRQINDAHWSVQPRWVKRLIIFAVLPAWLVAGYGIVAGSLDERVMDIAATIMIAGAAISTASIFAAYWRNDI